MTKKSSKNGHAPKPGDRPPTAYFLSLEVENVRCFGPKQKLDLSDGNGRPAPWTIILGVNGTGKTTLLQCIVGFDIKQEEVGLEIGSETKNPVSLKNAKIQSRRLLSNQFGTIPRTAATEGFVAVQTGFNADANKDYSINSTYLYINYKKEAKQYLLGGAVFITKDEQYPVVFAYGAGRKVGTIAFIEPVPNDDATNTLYLDTAELRNPEEWLLYLDYSVSKNKALISQSERRDQACGILKQVLWEIEDIRFIPGEGVRPKPRVEFKTPYGWVPFRQLGYGYQSLATWVADFASRMVERYPESKNPLAEPAVVLVDEIDLHLHPKWQRELMDRLTNLFPNTQFIATAHSPLVVQAAANANLAVLRREGDHVVIDNDVDYIRNWRVDQILTSDLFGLDSARPPHIAKLLAERDNLLAKSKLSKADEKKIADLESEIGELPLGETKQQRRMLDDIQQSLNLLKRERLSKK